MSLSTLSSGFFFFCALIARTFWACAAAAAAAMAGEEREGERTKESKRERDVSFFVSRSK
jgi:hypothetical protein